jgi:hypothetical protein
VLETNWGKEALKDYVKVSLYTDSDPHGKDYIQFTKRLFQHIGQPAYVVINPQGRVTAWLSNIRTVMSPPEHAQEAFQRFLDTSKTKGYAFDFETGFLPPDAQK